MGTKFVEVYNRFFGKITDDMYVELTPEDTLRDVRTLLIDSIPGFEFPRKNLNDYVIDVVTDPDAQHRDPSDGGQITPPASGENEGEYLPAGHEHTEGVNFSGDFSDGFTITSHVNGKRTILKVENGAIKSYTQQECIPEPSDPDPETPPIDPQNPGDEDLTPDGMPDFSHIVDESHFMCDLTAEEMNILALLMQCAWLNRQVMSIENTRMKYSGSDFKFTSQANHLQKLINLLHEAQRQSFHMQRLYKRRKTDENGLIHSNWSILRENSALDYQV